MVNVKRNAVTREFNFTKAIDFSDMPAYVNSYIYEDEIPLAAYKVGKDHGVMTDKKLLLFDNSKSHGSTKEIITVQYSTVAAHSVTFHTNSAEIYLLLQTGNPILLKFSNMNDADKLRLRLIYNAMSAAICGQKIPAKVMKRLVNNDLSFK